LLVPTIKSSFVAQLKQTFAQSCQVIFVDFTHFTLVSVLNWAGSYWAFLLGYKTIKKWC